VAALTLSAVTEVLSAAKVVSTATVAESVLVASLEAPPLQAVRAKEAAKASKKIDFFMVFYFYFYALCRCASSLCSAEL